MLSFLFWKTKCLSQNQIHFPKVLLNIYCKPSLFLRRNLFTTMYRLSISGRARGVMYRLALSLFFAHSL